LVEDKVTTPKSQPCRRKNCTLINSFKDPAKEKFKTHVQQESVLIIFAEFLIKLDQPLTFELSTAKINKISTPKTFSSLSIIEQFFFVANFQLKLV
jgi:hypothetical protein